MPLIPNFLERFLLMRMNLGPGAILDLWAAAGFRMAHSAVKLGIFDAMSQGPLTPDEVAQRTGTDERGVLLLLAALESFGYVKAINGRYSNTPLTSKWLLNDSPSRLADFLDWWRQIVFKFWDQHFDTAIRQGKPPQTIYEWLESEPRGWEITQAGFEATARFVVEDVVGMIGLPPGANRILDVGGGHGLYSIELCKRHPELSATIFDLPTALERARENIESEGLSDRVSVRAGDYREDDLGDGYDGALLFNVIHAHSAEENLNILERIGGALRPTGRMAILDQMDHKTFSPMFRGGIRLIAVAYFVLLGGQTYTYEEVKGWLDQVGFADVRRRNLLKAPGNVLVTATRSG